VIWAKEKSKAKGGGCQWEFSSCGREGSERPL